MAGRRGADDLFDSILFADERFRGEGYQEGFEKGTSRGLQNGRRHGASHGARLASEKAFKSARNSAEFDPNDSLDDPQAVKLQEDTEKLRSKFRQVCSMLNVPTDFKDYIKTAGGTSF